MHPADRQQWREHIVLTQDLKTAGERSDFFARARRGEFVALFRGVHIAASTWATLKQDARYRFRVYAAAARSGGDLLFSHESAASLWRLPSVAAWPETVHVLSGSAAGGRSTAMLVRHTLDLPGTQTAIDGLSATSLARTVVDIARRRSFTQAVAVADAALRRTSHPEVGVPRSTICTEDLLEEVHLLPRSQGGARAERVIEFADGRADRPGESLSRVNMHLAKIPPPSLQVELAGASGRMYTVDFWWKEFGLIGEFDGAYKYSDPAFLRGRTPEQALLDEKGREDDLRAAGFGMTRWRWKTAASVAVLRTHLVRAGIR